MNLTRTRRATSHSFTVLANDPSLTGWGWAVINETGIIATGCIKTAPENKKRRIRKGDDDTRRVAELATEIRHIITWYGVDFIISELPHGSQSASGMKMVGITMGILMSVSVLGEKPIEWYSEGDAKHALLKKRTATKDETIQAIKRELGFKDWAGVKYKDEAVADALAIYYVAKQQSQLIQFYHK